MSREADRETDAYETANDAKASFDDVYTAPTPHGYIAAMAKNGYQIGEQARPYCVAAANLLRARNGDAWPVQMLDVGCSYGIGSAFVKYKCSFDEMVAFFATRENTGVSRIRPFRVPLSRTALVPRPMPTGRCPEHR